MNKVDSCCPDFFPLTREWRRHLHRHPELSGREIESARFISRILTDYDIEHQSNLGGHGLVARIGNHSGSRKNEIAFRADFDALPLNDHKTTAYASNNPGVMHACAHDAHAATLLGLAAALKQNSQLLKCPVKFIFQPAEENGQGAAAMLKEGLFTDPPAAIFGFHFFPEMEAGSARLHRQTFMAATEHFTITVKGRAAHACIPEKSIDAIQVAAQLILAFNHLICKNLDPIDPALISIGTINGGTVSNIIADQVVMTGTIRSLSLEQHQRLHSALQKIVKELPQAFGAAAEIEVGEVAPALENNPRLCELMVDILTDNQLVTHFEDNGPPLLGGEDFARFAQLVPGCYLFFGCGNQQRGIIHPLHSSLFDLDEKALDVALTTMYSVALKGDEIIEKLKA
jgi:amidohydrolase